jgi:hypothetical protein
MGQTGAAGERFEMSTTEDALEDLAEVERDIAEIEMRITEQAAAVGRIKGLVQSDSGAIQGGLNLQKVLREQHMHRELVLARIAQLEERRGLS